MRVFLFALALPTLLVSRAQSPAHILYLVGDAGEAGPKYSQPVLDLVKQVSATDSAKARTLLFLGDNIYEFGLHKKGHKSRIQDEHNIDVQIQLMKDFDGKSYIIPGNHDWRQGKEHGLNYVKRQEEYIEKALDRKAFKPDGGCPGPEVVKLGDNAALVLMDTQWWLHGHRRSEGEKDGCPVAMESDLLKAMGETLKDNAGKRIIVAGHHPLYTYGSHGGYFPLREHLFPLTAINKKLYVPLPGVGSIYPVYRGLIGDVQDAHHGKYRALRNGMQALFKQYPGLVYAAGHEHTLQYSTVDGVHHVVSGAGAKNTWLKKSRRLKFGKSERGFARIVVSPDGAMRLDFFTVSGGVLPVYSQPIEGSLTVPLVASTERPKPVLLDSVTVVPNADLAASSLHKLFFGKLYRDVWTAPIRVPVLDLDTAFGGLSADKKGGGLQTRSLRLSGKDNHDYVLRTIKKYPGLALAPEFRGTLVEELVSDGIAASHPYASIVIGNLADAVNVLHTSPKMVFVPDHPALGPYRDDFANSLCLLEERTDGDWSDKASLGASKELVSSADLITALRTSHKASLDDRAMLRARLFDNLIGDWDRHDDQWRWASYKHGDHTIYKPIPRDRDQAFFTQNGILPSIVNRKWAIGKFQSFGPQIRDIRGQNFNARYLDRAYLTELEWPAWKAIADSMRSELSDATIEQAIRLLPAAAYAAMGERVIAGLKARRDDLERIARRHFEVLARQVDVVGTDGDEFFEVKRLNKDETEVNVYDREKGKKVKGKRYFHRVFKRGETKEIRIYGQEGNDEYRIDGNVRKGIRIRIIGGTEKDKIQDSSSVAGWSHKTVVYETGFGKKSNKLQLGKEARLVRSAHADALDYEREEYVPDVLMPLVSIGANPDDGLFLGGGFRLTKQGFKVAPFKWRHQFLGSYALQTGAFRVTYKGRVNHAIGRNDLGFDFGVFAPDFNFNFFGFGNRTEKPLVASDFRYRIDLIDLKPYVERRLGSAQRVRLQARYLAAGQGRLVSSLDDDKALAELTEVDYVGGSLTYALENVDAANDPGRGIRFIAELDMHNEIERDRTILGAGAALTFYFPVEWLGPRSVFALRAAGYRRDGLVDPVLARSIGGGEEVRGMRRTRFSGNSSAYGNAELRVDLFRARNAALPFKVGLTAFADAGRVWTDGLDEHFWHSAVGGGFYISPLNMLVLNASYAVSDDDQVFDLRLGFFF
ncbi:MAG: metallophosphoesterase [Flavobacteriales bacterium]|nr:metallophosphoesterase [Flavobacteriales bacterium]